MACKLSEDWQGKKTLVECNKYMLQNKISDVTFKLTYCETGESSPPVNICALKTLLLARSSVFHAMFWGELQEQSQIIEVTDVEPGAFTELIRYCYTDEVHFTPDNVIDVLYASKKYMISSLTDLCAKYMEESLTSETAPIRIDQSIFFGLPDLIPKCIQKIQFDTSTVFASDAFTNLSPEAFHGVLESDTMNATELEVFNASVKWAETQCKMQSKKATAANKRKVLGDTFYLIRFPSLTVREFNDEVYPQELLTDIEGAQVSRYIATNYQGANFPFITRKRNRLKFELVAANVVREKKLLLMKSPFQDIPVASGRKTRTTLQCSTSHTIVIHKVLVHAAGWPHNLSLSIKKAANTLYQQQDKREAVTTSEACKDCHCTAKMQNVVVTKGQFEIDINLSSVYYMDHKVKVCPSNVTCMSDGNLTINIDKLTGHNLLLGLKYSLF